MASPANSVGPCPAAIIPAHIHRKRRFACVLDAVMEQDVFPEEKFMAVEDEGDFRSGRDRAGSLRCRRVQRSQRVKAQGQGQEREHQKLFHVEGWTERATERFARINASTF